MKHKDITKLTKEEYKEELSLYEKFCKGICRYITENNNKYEFSLVKDKFADSDESAVFWKRTLNTDKKNYTYLYSAYANGKEGGYLKCYMTIIDYWFRNMAIDIDDESYREWCEDKNSKFMVEEKDIRKRSYVKFPYYDNIREAIIKLGLMGIDVS